MPAVVVMRPVAIREILPKTEIRLVGSPALGTVSAWCLPPSGCWRGGLSSQAQTPRVSAGGHSTGAQESVALQGGPWGQRRGSAQQHQGRSASPGCRPPPLSCTAEVPAPWRL